MARIIELLKSALLAGIAISIGCIVNLKVGDYLGPILFSFGLITVVHYKLGLYTGTAGFVQGKRDLLDMLFILLGNIIGCLFMAILASCALPDIIGKCDNIYDIRHQCNATSLLILSSFCGFIMTTAVTFARKDKYLPLLFGVPLFILSGFYHSIADAFYLSCAMVSGHGNASIATSYILIVLGNFIGCNLYRIIMWKK